MYRPLSSCFHDFSKHLFTLLRLTFMKKVAPLLLFSIFFLHLAFNGLIITCLNVKVTVVNVTVYSSGNLLRCLNVQMFVFYQFAKSLAIMSSRILSMFFSFPLGTSIKHMLVCLMVSCRSLRLCFIFLHPFSLFLFLRLDNPN